MELAGHICQENNRFPIDLKDNFGNPFFEKTTGAKQAGDPVFMARTLARGR